MPHLNWHNKGFFQFCGERFSINRNGTILLMIAYFTPAVFQLHIWPLVYVRAYSHIYTPVLIYSLVNADTIINTDMWIRIVVLKWPQSILSPRFKSSSHTTYFKNCPKDWEFTGKYIQRDSKLSSGHMICTTSNLQLLENSS